MAYEIDFRKRILDYIDSGKTVDEASQFFNVASTSIVRWRKMRVESGSLADPVRKRNFKKIDPQKLEAYITENPDAYLSEIADVFQCATSSVH